MPALRLVALAAVLLAAPQLAEAQVDPCAAGKFFTAGKCTAQCGVLVLVVVSATILRRPVDD